MDTGSEQRFLTPLCRAPRENQGRLDFEQRYRENGTFVRKVHPIEKIHKMPQGNPRRPKGIPQVPQDGQRGPKGWPKGVLPREPMQGRPKGAPKWSQGITPRIVQVDILVKLHHSRNYQRHQAYRKKTGSHAAHLLAQSFDARLAGIVI